MILINEHYLKLQASYLFSNIAKRVNAFQLAHPDRKIIRLGIGDVTRALPDACIQALHRAVDEMAGESTFRGYGPEQGYGFLREAAAKHDFQARGADIAADEIFISDGSKCDTGNIQELFAQEIAVAIPDPVYPVYLDTNVMAGRTGKFTDGRYDGIVYLESTRENGFVPALPTQPVDLIYLCFPNNPTGATITRAELARWVEYAREHKALILYDAAYESFIRDESLPRSIYEIEGAREVAVEFRSYSKTAGFTGTRCAYTVVPKDCTIHDSGEGNIRCTPCGTAGTRPSSTASPTRCNARPKPSTQRRGRNRSRRSLTATCAMRRSSARRWPRSDSNASGGRTPLTSGSTAGWIRGSSSTCC
jgi:LL-diaminopimelate aminotransferase